MVSEIASRQLLKEVYLMSNNVKIVAILTAHEGKAEALRALLDGMVAPSRAEPGNLRYDLWEDQAQPGRFIIDELYTDSSAIDAHRKTAHFENYFSVIGDLAERTVFVLDPVEVG